MTSFVGPVEERSWPSQLTARVVKPGPQPEIHGYDVQGDLARNYHPIEVSYLSLVGEVPSRQEGEALRAVAVFLAPLSVAHGPTHAAVLSRLSGGPTANIVAVAATALAEQARYEVKAHLALLPWLKGKVAEFPAEYVATESTTRTAVDALRTALGDFTEQVPALRHDPTLMAALFSVLFATGLTSSDAWEVLLVQTRLPAVVAEALAEKPTNFRAYPMNLPHFKYVPREGSR